VRYNVVQSVDSQPMFQRNSEEHHLQDRRKSQARMQKIAGSKQSNQLAEVRIRKQEQNAGGHSFCLNK
jgi:hypothetical protein